MTRAFSRSSSNEEYFGNDYETLTLHTIAIEKAKPAFTRKVDT
jgi:hypothetical protein